MDQVADVRLEPRRRDRVDADVLGRPLHRERGARLGQPAGHGRAQPARAAHHHRGLPVQPEEIEARHARRAGWISSSVMSSGSKKYTPLAPALRPWVISTGADLKRTPLA